MNLRRKGQVTSPNPTSHKQLIMIIGTILGFILVAVIGLIAFNSTTECDTDACFIERANRCDRATLLKDAEGSTMILKTNNCRMTKEFKSFSSSEPEDVVSLLEGKRMTCTYDQNMFDRFLLIPMTADVEKCEGELIIALQDLQLAQFIAEATI